MSDLPISAHVSGKGKVTYVYADGRTVTLHGAHPYRDNNPGNLRYAGKGGLERARKAGAISIDNEFAIFPDRSAGVRAQSAMIGRLRGQTLTGFLAIYAPPGENNFPAYLAAVEKATGAKAADSLESLSPAQRDVLAETIITIEGGNSPRNQYSAPVWSGVASPVPPPAPLK